MATGPRKSAARRPRKRDGGASAASTQDAAKPRHGSGREGGTSAWEWAVAGVGGVILAAVVGFLVYEAIARPPDVRPEIGVAGAAPLALGNGTFLVPVTVTNTGHATGADVSVSGALVDGDGATIEESTITFDFVAQHSTETGGLYFTADPRSNRLVLRVEGYTDP